MHNNRVVALATSQMRKAWTSIRLSKPRPNVDPNLPASYLIDIQGLRGDGITFSVTVVVEKPKYDLLPGSESIMAAAYLLDDGIKQLLTFTGCACTKEAECERHAATVN